MAKIHYLEDARRGHRGWLGHYRRLHRARPPLRARAERCAGVMFPAALRAPARWRDARVRLIAASRHSSAAEPRGRVLHAVGWVERSETRRIVETPISHLPTKPPAAGLVRYRPPFGLRGSTEAEAAPARPAPRPTGTGPSRHRLGGDSSRCCSRRRAGLRGPRSPGSRAKVFPLEGDPWRAGITPNLTAWPRFLSVTRPLACRSLYTTSHPRPLCCGSRSCVFGVIPHLLAIERESTALRPWPAAYRFNLLRRLLAGRLRVRRFRDAVSLIRRASNSFTSCFPTLRRATRVMRFWPVGIESPATQWATAVALTPTSRARAVWLSPRRRRKLSMSRGESRAAFASASDTCGIAGAASMSRFQPFALRRSIVTIPCSSPTFRRSRTTSRRSGVITTRTCLRAPRVIASLITVSSFANERLLVKVRQRSNQSGLLCRLSGRPPERASPRICAAALENGRGKVSQNSTIK